MSDTISILKEMLAQHNDLLHGVASYTSNEGLRSYIAALSDAIAQLEWVPVTPDTMPPIGETVIIVYANCLTTGFYNGKLWWNVHGSKVDVTHWRPLPKEAP